MNSLSIKKISWVWAWRSFNFPLLILHCPRTWGLALDWIHYGSYLRLLQNWSWPATIWFVILRMCWLSFTSASFFCCSPIVTDCDFFLFYHDKIKFGLSWLKIKNSKSAGMHPIFYVFKGFAAGMAKNPWTISKLILLFFGNAIYKSFQNGVNVFHQF